MIIAGKGHRRLACFLDLHAQELFFETGDEHMGPDLQEIAIGLHALVGFPVYNPLKIDGGKIPFRQLAHLLHILHGAVHLAKLFKSGLNILLFHGQIGFLQFHPQVVLRFDDRLHLDGRGEGEGCTPVDDDLADLGLGQGNDLMGFHR